MHPVLDDPDVDLVSLSWNEHSDANARRVSERAARASKARHASTRRQKIDPTTCERDYTPAQLEFMQAIQAYKQASGRMFPTWSEVLEVLQSLGYEKSA
jgi:hypothetical protein